MAGPIATLETVVVGIDGSPSAETALRWTLDRVGPDATVHLVHGFSPSAALLAGAFQQDTRARRDEVEALLNGPWAAPLIEAGREPLVHLVDDDPADALLAVAERLEADTIVVGTHGETGRHPHFVGGVTRKLLRHSPLPVVVVDRAARDAAPATDDAEETDTPETARSEPGMVLACVGYGAAAHQAVEWAAAYAEATGRPLHLFHAVSDRPVYPLDSPVDMLGSYLGPGVDLAWAAEDLKATRDELRGRWPDLTITATVVQGSAVGAILAAADGSDLVVVGKPHGAPFFRAPISPRLYQLLARTTRSTAVVPSCEPRG